MAFIDYYKILGVDKNIPQKDVRAAYRKRAKQFHPDLHPNDPKAKAKFQALSEAFDVIGNPEKRAKYDKYGERWKDADSFENFNRQTSGWSGRGAENPFDGFDFGNIRSDGFSSFFQDLFGRGDNGAKSSKFNHKTSSNVSGDRNVSIDLDFYTAILGGEVIISLSRENKVKLKVKPYTQNGAKVRLKGKGYNKGNGIIGDLILKYNVKMPTSLTDRQKELLIQMRDAR